VAAFLDDTMSQAQRIPKAQFWNSDEFSCAIVVCDGCAMEGRMVRTIVRKYRSPSASTRTNKRGGAQNRTGVQGFAGHNSAVLGGSAPFSTSSDLRFVFWRTWAVVGVRAIHAPTARHPTTCF